MRVSVHYMCGKYFKDLKHGDVFYDDDADEPLMKIQQDAMCKANTVSLKTGENYVFDDNTQIRLYSKVELHLSLCAEGVDAN